MNRLGDGIYYDVNGNLHGVQAGVDYDFGTHFLEQSMFAIGTYPGGAAMVGIVAWHPWVSGTGGSVILAPHTNAVLVNQTTGQSFFNSQDVPNSVMIWWIGLTSVSALPGANFSPYSHGIPCFSSSSAYYP